MKVIVYANTVEDMVADTVVNSNSYYIAYRRAYKIYLDSVGIKTTPAQIKSFLTELGEAIETKDFERLQPLANPANKFSRAVFWYETDIRLPKTRKSSLEALIKYVGKTRYKSYLRKQERTQKLEADKQRKDKLKLVRSETAGLTRTDNLVEYLMSDNVSADDIHYSVRILTTPNQTYWHSTLPTYQYIDELWLRGFTVSRRGKTIRLSNGEYTVTYRNLTPQTFSILSDYTKFVFAKHPPYSVKDNDTDIATDEDIKHLFGVKTKTEDKSSHREALFKQIKAWAKTNLSAIDEAKLHLLRTRI